MRVRGREEGRRSGCAPIHQQPVPARIGEAGATDVHGTLVAHDAAEAQVERVPPEGTESGTRAVDLEVTVERLLPRALVAPPQCIEPRADLGRRTLEGGGDRREVRLVGGDERRITLGGESVGKVEDAGVRCHDRRFSAPPRVLRQAPGCFIQ
jgi:hypothetical protein